MSSATSSEITPSNKVRDEDENCDLNESEVPVVSSENRAPRPAIEIEEGEITESLRKNGVEFRRCTSNCLMGGSLECAARVGDIKLVKLWICHGADVNGSGRKGSSPLHVAASYGHPEIIELLIKNGARLDSALDGPTKNGYTPLHLACMSNKIECVKVLLKYGASVTPTRADVHHPIHIAVFGNFCEVAALLLKNGADVNIRFDNKFFHNKWDEAIFWKDMDMTLLHCAIARKYKEMTSLLLEHGADIHLNTRSNKTSLMHAVEANDPDLVESFLAKGANPNDRDIYGKPVVFYLVLKRIQSVYYNQKEFDSDKEKLEIMKLLYAAGADVNVKFGPDKSLNSLVHQACMDGQSQLALFLLHRTDFDWRTIDYKLFEISTFSEEALSPEDREDMVFALLIAHGFKALRTDLLYYIFALHMIGYPIKEELLTTIQTVPHFLATIKRIENELRAEINLLKQTTIGNTKITLWHLLTCKMEELMRLSVHEDFRNLCLENYSHYKYYDMIEFRWETAVKRRTLIEKSSKLMFDLFRNQLPYDCYETMASFFQNRELGDFIKKFSNNISR